MARLPVPGNDQGTWGDVLNDFLDVSHNADGTLKNSIVDKQNLAANVFDDASNTTKGVIALSGDLGGTASAPTVPGLAAKANLSSLAAVATSGSYNDLTNKPSTSGVPADGSITTAKLADSSVTLTKLSAGSASSGQVLASDGNMLVWTTPSAQGTISDASANSKGILQLTGDLTGTASSPTIADGAITNTKLSSAVQSTLSSVASKADNSAVVHLSGAETIAGSKTFSSPVSIASPTANGHAATKSYVDTQISTASGGSGSGSPTVANGQTIHADNVPSNSGLSNVAADNSTDDAATLQAQLNYIKSTWGGGTLVLPSAKTMRIQSGLSLPSNVRIIGDRTSLLRYEKTSGAAITVNDGSRTPLAGFRLFGPSSGGPGSSVGIDISGARNTFRELEIRYFYRGLNLVNDDTYINTFESMMIGNCTMCVWADIVNVSGSGTSANNSGERTVFNNCLFDNSTQAVYFSAPGSSVFFTNTSIDFVGKFGTLSDVNAGFVNCHLEGNYGALQSQNSGPKYMFELLYSARVTLTNVIIILAGGGSPSFMLVKPGGSAGSSAYMHLNSVFCYFTGADGSDHNVKSEAVFDIAAGATSFTTYVPWSPTWSATKVGFVFNNGHVVPNGITAAVASFSETTGQVTINFSSAVQSAASLSIDFGK